MQDAKANTDGPSVSERSDVRAQGAEQGLGAAPISPSLAEIFRVSGRIGLLSFGGPAGQIALMHRVYVDEKRWLSEQQYLSALNFCMLLPGPEAMQLATYVGWRSGGMLGGLISGLLFVLPGAAVVLALSAIYAAFGSVPLVEAIFVGIKAAVLAIVLEALLKVAKRALKVTTDWLIAVAAFAAIFAFNVPFPLIIMTAAIIGFLRASGAGERASEAGAAGVDTAERAPLQSFAVTARTIVLWLAIWLAPLVALTALLGNAHVLAQIGWFFSKLAVVTFGGAYAVLASMGQEAVQNYAWLKPGEMLDGLGLAETTPGPLILVTEFVGFLAGLREGGWAMGLAAAAVTLWATFAPCFLWIFAGAPYVDWLGDQPRLRGALSAVTAAVVGVILNLSVWFALNVLFSATDVQTLGALRVQLPVLTSVDVVACALAVAAVLLLFVARIGVLATLAACAVAALALSFLPVLEGALR
ncbi:MAG: chromate efflux transporter [Pseudomonadota bacterium]